MAQVYYVYKDLYRRDDNKLIPFLGIEYGPLAVLTGDDLAAFMANWQPMHDAVQALIDAGTLFVADLPDLKQLMV